MGKQGQSRGAQLYAVHMSDQKGWSQNPPLTTPHLRIGRGDEGILLELSVYLRRSEGEQFFFSYVFLFVVVHLSKSLVAEAWDLVPMLLLLRFLSCYTCLLITVLIRYLACVLKYISRLKGPSSE